MAPPVTQSLSTAVLAQNLMQKAARIQKTRTASSNPVAYAFRLRRKRVPVAKARVPSPRRVEGSGVDVVDFSVEI